LSLTLRKKFRFRVFENRMLRTIFESKRLYEREKRKKEREETIK
jgi:hypothetical protein